jgi:protein O-GlcNAc transferase
MNLQLLCNQAAGYHQAGRLVEAQQLYLQILQADSRNFFAYHMLGILRSQQGRNLEALELIAAALKVQPNSTEALSNYGNFLTNVGRLHDALAAFDKALAIGPKYAETLTNRGSILWRLKRPREALESYDEALRIKPNLLEALSSRANVLRHLGRLDEALDSCSAALRLKPDFVEALNERGATLSRMNRFEEALISYDKALAVRPNNATVLGNRGSTLLSLKRVDEALANFEKALAIEPGSAETLSNRGIALSHLKRFDEALSCYAKALAIQPDLVEGLGNRGHTLRETNRLDEALASYDQALSIAPDFARALNSRGLILSDMRRFGEALACHERALTMDPRLPTALGNAANAALNLCDWPRTARYAQELEADIRAHKSVIPPFLPLGYSADQSLQLQCAKNYIQERVPILPQPLWKGEIYRHDKIRIAYLSADFREHATAHLMAGLFERHDRSRFEVTAISFGPDDGSAMRARLVKAFDHFHDVQLKSDRDVAKLLREMEVDIAIDLKGHTQDARPEIFSHRPCPVQASYLGYPGTTGADFMDYVLADRIVAPLGDQPFFTEKLVHLSHSYQVNDSTRAIPEKTPTRAEAGLPEAGFVFCCFNNNWKITAPVFRIWMRLLKDRQDSVLWLLDDNGGASVRLCAEAAEQGIDPGRLVFAPRTTPAEHLARHGLADLFLDTLPYNAHTTASDALWMGLPLVTCTGTAFPGRVATSLLHAVGLPELATNDLEHYEALARNLAGDPVLLQSVWQTLANNRLSTPLFDTDGFRRDLEAAYTQMWERAERGEATRGFAVGA